MYDACMCAYLVLLVVSCTCSRYHQGLACFLFASHFFVSSSSEGDDCIAFLGLRRVRGVTGGVAVGDVAARGVAAGGGSVTVSERNKKKLETFDEM